MPFDDDLLGVYEGLKECLGNEGFEVDRADQQLSQGNILSGIISAINEADLIVADLTGLNANVMYELGVAHALDTPVVIVTQDLEIYPFDLKNYRAMPYSPLVGSNRFGKFIEEFESRISEIDRGLKFGSPVSDFLDDHDRPVVECFKDSRGRGGEDAVVPEQEVGGTTLSRESTDRTQVVDPDLGVLDHALYIHEGSQQVAESFSRLAGAGDELNTRLRRAGALVEGAQGSSGPEAIRSAQVAAGMVAQALRTFRTAANEENTRLKDRWTEMDRALVGLVEWQLENLESEQRETVQETVDSAASAGEAAMTLLGSLGELRQAVRTVYGLNRNLNREVDATSFELDQLVAMVSDIAATFNRVANIDPKP